MKLWFQSFYMRHDAECQSEDDTSPSSLASVFIEATPSVGVSFKAIRDDMIHSVVEANNDALQDVDEDEMVDEALMEPRHLTLELVGGQPDLDGDATVDMNFILRDVRFPDTFVAWGRIYSRELPGVMPVPGLPDHQVAHTTTSRTDYLRTIQMTTMTVPEKWEDLGLTFDTDRRALPPWDQLKLRAPELCEAISALWLEAYRDEHWKTYVQGGVMFTLEMQVERFLTELTAEELIRHVNDFLEPASP